MIKQILKDKKQFIDLLLLADEQESMIDKYIEKGDMFALYDAKSVVSICVVTQEDERTIEIKNIVTAPRFQKQGYGKKLIQYLEDYYAGQFSTLIVGTGDSPVTTVFYEKCGFTRFKVVSNFFVDNYDHPIFEGGVQLIDMIYFSKKIKKASD